MARNKKITIQVLKLRKHKWYEELICDCRQIIREENLDIIRRKHQLGSRVLREKENIPYGQIFTFMKTLAKDLDYSWQDLYFCTKFADKYPDIDSFIEKFSNKLEKFTWYNITQVLLYERLTEPSETSEIIKCDLCMGEFKKVEIPSVHICAYCYANLLADREAKKIEWLK